ncbi:zinc finger protein [Aphelenchoides avenae]|nr:zinc finger protein [Aphelenchus avenae]
MVLGLRSRVQQQQNSPVQAATARNAGAGTTTSTTPLPPTPKAADPPPAAAQQAPIEQPPPVKSTEMNSSTANSSRDCGNSLSSKEMASSHMDVDEEAPSSHSQPSSCVGKHPSPDMSEVDQDEDLILIIPSSGEDDASAALERSAYEESNASEISGPAANARSPPPSPTSASISAVISSITSVATGANGSVPSYYCTPCAKTFPTAKMLQQHNQTFHTDKSFVCEICGKAFRFRSNLAEHRSVHTALKPFVCKYCGKSSRLKGNLTKHILKHHKTEQKDYIGKDDIIIKKGKKSVKDPAAIDFLEKSMIVLPSSAAAAGSNGHGSDGSVTPLDMKSSTGSPACSMEQCVLMSLGLDAGSLDLSLKSEMQDSDGSGLGDSLLTRQSTNDSLLAKCNMAMEVGDDPVEDGPMDMSPFNNAASGAMAAIMDNVGQFLSSVASSGASFSLPNSSGGGLNGTRKVIRNGTTASSIPGLEKLIPPTTTNFVVHKTTTTNSLASMNGNGTNRQLVGSPSKTQCPECGKHLRKPRDLVAHLATIHHIAPTGGQQAYASTSSPERHSPAPFSENGEASPDASTVQSELRQIKLALGEMRSANKTAKLEQMVSTLDTRVGRLEKQLEMALNSIYTLVQLQTGINSVVTRFRDDASDQLKNVLQILTDSSP